MLYFKLEKSLAFPRSALDNLHELSFIFLLSFFSIQAVISDLILRFFFFCTHRAWSVVSLVLRVVMGKTVPRSASATMEGPVTQRQVNAIAAQVTQGNGKENLFLPVSWTCKGPTMTAKVKKLLESRIKIPVIWLRESYEMFHVT